MGNQNVAVVTQTTHNIQIEVKPQFIPEESDKSKNYFFFAYSVKIKNLGNVPAQLLNRHWIITNGFGTTEEVRGPGVVGLQPIIMPGQDFEYSSFCSLATPTGSMRGTYQMSFDDGSNQEIPIPQFYLVEPNSYH